MTRFAPGKVAMARSLYNDHSNAIEDICKTLGISRATLYRNLDTTKDRDTTKGS